MLCLFRNSNIHPRLDPAAIALSWIATLYWLHFAFIEKELFGKIQAGHALLIDLLFGLPLVLAFAVMIYATVYWLIKVILVLLWPAALVAKPQAPIEETFSPEDEQHFGKDYWQNSQESYQEPRQESYQQADDAFDSQHSDSRSKK